MVDIRNPEAESLHAPILGSMNLPWRKLLPQASKASAPAGACIGQGLPCIDFFYLASGRLMIMHSDAEGHERAMFRLGPGNLFNEAPAATGFDAPDSPFVAEQKCVYYRFSHSLLHDRAFVAENPDLIINLMMGLGAKVLLLHTSLGNKTGIPAVVRLSRFFAGLAARHGCLSFDPAMTQESMATLLGIDRATLVRALRILREKGAIGRSTKHSLEILNLDLLRSLSE